MDNETSTWVQGLLRRDSKVYSVIKSAESESKKHGTWNGHLNFLVQNFLVSGVSQRVELQAFNDGKLMKVFYPVSSITLRVQVPKNHIPTQNLYYNYYYPNPKYLNIGYMDKPYIAPLKGT